MQDLLSSKNHHLKRLKKLVQQRKARSAERVFVVEGPLGVAELLASTLEVDSVFVGLESDSDPGRFGDLVHLARSEDVPVRFCRLDGLATSLGTVNPQPIAAIATQPSFSVESLDRTRPLLVLIDVADPGNVGTLARTAEASGCAGLAVLGRSVDVWSPKVVRASAGALLRLPVPVVSDVIGPLNELKAQGRAVLATVVSETAKPYSEVDLRSAAIVLGNEAQGLSAEVATACSHQITINLDGPTESLNVATAGAVLCFEALRQRRL